MNTAPTSHDPARAPHGVRLVWRVLLGAGALVVLGGVFMLYTQPDFMISMADQLWSCF